MLLGFQELYGRWRDGRRPSTVTTSEESCSYAIVQVIFPEPRCMYTRELSSRLWIPTPTGIQFLTTCHPHPASTPALRPQLHSPAPARMIACLPALVFACCSTHFTHANPLPKAIAKLSTSTTIPLSEGNIDLNRSHLLPLIIRAMELTHLIYTGMC